MKIVIILFLFLTTFIGKSKAGDLFLYIEPYAELNNMDFHFDGFLDYGIKNINKKTLYPQADYNTQFNPGIFIRADYEKISIRSGITFSNYFADISSTLFPRGLAYQYDGNRNHRYYLGEHFTKTNEKIMFGNTKHDFYLGFNYDFYNNLKIGFLYLNSDTHIGKGQDHDISGVQIDTLGTYVNHNHITNSYFFELQYDYKISDFELMAIADFSPFTSYKVTHSSNIVINKIYDAYSYKLGCGVKWKWLFANYYYSSYQTKDDLFSNQSHTVRFGFSWQALKFNLDKLDIFN